MKLVDSHCHLYDVKNYSVPSDIVPVIVGYSHSSNKKAVEIAKKNSYPLVLGIAPQTAIRSDLSELQKWIDFIKENRPNAIGEVGLDYKWAQTKEDVEKEKIVLKRMFDLADEMDLPIVIHSRNNPSDNDSPKNAVDDILQLLTKRPFLMHFFSGSEPQAKEIVTRGGHISITHIHSKEKRKIINTVPLDKLLVESDSPYVGRTPETIRDAIQYISEVKGIDFKKVASKTAHNASSFFGFSL